MLVLRILALPIAMLSFAILYTIAIKAPEAVEAGNLVLWIVVPLLVAGKFIWRRA
ncbi:MULTISPECIES: hypothetical protein [unclassified Rhizobium]|uniref:hypothetical protein n=1 Tax=unclassified Rhizobium TaxID=2613769 RepID=UPI000BD074CE|nr:MULTISPECIES: hypothetical protein [unclassified Rhizobium]MDH7806834.1 hypothetical protein [Rhizobium sp. AN67]MDQ4408118.1 hypothetical protein [Rhizobium sp. AN63]SOD57727.1 hypothetical protein SAMN05216595_3833 [Rhizobium sp. AN6A]